MVRDGRTVPFPPSPHGREFLEESGRWVMQWFYYVSSRSLTPLKLRGALLPQAPPD